MSDAGAATFSAVFQDAGFSAGVQKAIQALVQFDQQLTNVSNQMKTAFQSGPAQINQITQSERQWSSETVNLASSHRTLGQSIKENALSIGVAASGIVGLISQFHGLEAAHVSLERAQQRVNTTTFAVTKAQEAYNAAVKKYGAGSREAIDAETKLTNVRNAQAIAVDRAKVSQDTYNDALLQFATQTGPSLIQTGAGIVQMITGLRGSTTLAATANAAFAASSVEASGGAILVADSDLMLAGASAEAAAGEDAAGIAGLGMGAKMAIIAAPIIAVAVGLTLIGTNAFGMRDRFNQAMDAVGTAIDVVAKGWLTMSNAIMGAVVTTNNTIQTAWNSTAAFFINNLVNPIIRGWNQLSAALNTFTADPLGAIQRAFQPAATWLLGNFKTMAEGWNKFMEGLKTISGGVVKGPTFDTESLKKAMAVSQEAFKPKVGAGGAAIPLVTPPAPTEGALKFTPFDPSQVKIGQQISSTLKSNVDGMAATLVAVERLGLGMISGKVSTADFLKGITNTIPGMKKLVDGLGGASAGALGAASGMKAAAPPMVVLSDHTTKLNADLAKNTVELRRRYQEMQTGNELTTEYNAGVQDTKMKLLDDIDALARNAGALQELNSEQQSGIRYAADYQMGVQAAQKALLDLNDANVTARGSIEEVNKEIQAGTFQFANYQKGVLETGKAYDDAVAKLSQLNAQLTNSTAILNRHNAAIVEGKTQFADFIIKTQDAVTTNKEYTTELQNMTAAFFKANPEIEQTKSNLEAAGKAMIGDKEAAKQLADEAEKAFAAIKSAGDDLLKSAGDISAKFKDFMKGIPKFIQESMPKTFWKDVFQQGQIKNSIEESLHYIEGAFATGGGAAAVSMAQNLSSTLLDKISNMKPDVQAKWQGVIDLLNQAPSDPAQFVAWTKKLEAAIAAVDDPAKASLMKIPTYATAAANAIKIDQFAAKGKLAGQAFSQGYTSGIQALIGGGAAQITTGAKLGAGAAGAAGVTLGKPIAGAAAGAADPFAAQTKSLSLLNAVVLNSQKDLSLLNAVILNTTKDFSLANAVVLNSQKDLSLLNSVVVNSQKDFSLLNDVSLNTQKDFSLLNSVIVNTQKDLTTATAAAKALTTALIALTSAAASAIKQLSSLISVIGKVGSSASSAAGQVRSLASAINSLQSKTITLTTIHRTVNQTVAAQHGFHSILTTPTNILAGEAGPERVDITPLNQTRTAAVHHTGGGSSPIRLDSTTNIYIDSEKLTTIRHSKLIDRYIGSVATAAG